MSTSNELNFDPLHYSESGETNDLMRLLEECQTAMHDCYKQSIKIEKHLPYFVLDSLTDSEREQLKILCSGINRHALNEQLAIYLKYINQHNKQTSWSLIAQNPSNMVIDPETLKQNYSLFITRLYNIDYYHYQLTRYPWLKRIYILLSLCESLGQTAMIGYPNAECIGSVIAYTCPKLPQEVLNSLKITITLSHLLIDGLFIRWLQSIKGFDYFFHPLSYMEEPLAPAKKSSILSNIAKELAEKPWFSFELGTLALLSSFGPYLGLCNFIQFLYGTRPIPARWLIGLAFTQLTYSIGFYATHQPKKHPAVKPDVDSKMTTKERLSQILSYGFTAIISLITAKALLDYLFCLFSWLNGHLFNFPSPQTTEQNIMLYWKFFPIVIGLMLANIHFTEFQHEAYLLFTKGNWKTICSRQNLKTPAVSDIHTILSGMTDANAASSLLALTTSLLVSFKNPKLSQSCYWAIFVCCYIWIISAYQSSVRPILKEETEQAWSQIHHMMRQFLGQIKLSRQPHDYKPLNDSDSEAEDLQQIDFSEQKEEAILEINSLGIQPAHTKKVVEISEVIEMLKKVQPANQHQQSPHDFMSECFSCSSHGG